MQMKKPPLTKNQKMELKIDALTSEGSGVGRVDGYAVFVPGALPGETVLAHVIKVTSGYAVARPAEILSASPARVKPLCPAYAACGGCTLQHLDYAGQLTAKQQSVTDALTRLGGIAAPPVRPILGMDEPWRYRNKGSFPFGEIGGTAAFGFYAARSHRIVPIADCPIQDGRVIDVVRRAAAWADENGVSAYDEDTQKGCLRHVMARVTRTGETLAVIVTHGALPKQAALLDALEGVDSLWHNRNDKNTNVIFGDSFTHLAGRETVTETIGELSFELSPQSFLQVNPAQTEKLYGAAIELLAPEPDACVVDAYCGIGTISLLLAGKVRRVIGIEQVEPAVADATRNAARNGISHAEFRCGNVEDILPALLSEETVSALVLDPPRKGCEEAALRAIGESSLERVVYVSCNPATLARDIKLLAAYGFALKAAQPVDMFPQTVHVECVVLLSRLMVTKNTGLC